MLPTATGSVACIDVSTALRDGALRHPELDAVLLEQHVVDIGTLVRSYTEGGEVSAALSFRSEKWIAIVRGRTIRGTH
jgi:hypothetical protein